MKHKTIFTPWLKLVMLSVPVLLVACSSSTSSTGAADAGISGTIIAAPVNGAEVTIVDGSGNIVAGPATTNSTGLYTLNIPNGSLAQDLIVKSTGGSFTDEATGNSGVAGEMYAYASANSLSDGSSVSATPGSTIIANLVMHHNKTMAEAELAFANAFGYTPDMTITPADATVASADATMEAKLAGFRAATFSQMAMDLGLSQNDQFEMFSALAQDLSDGTLDGVDKSGPVAIGTTGFSLKPDARNRFAKALVNFKSNANNLSGLDNNEFGDIPFSKVALTTSYKVEYIPTGTMAPNNGKSTFQIHVTNLSDGNGATGLAPMLMPMMHMLGTHQHSTPMPAPAIIEGVDGLYTVTLYYLMPTAMGGYWDLKFMIAGEEAHFYPEVMMAMGDTTQVRLKGVNDKIMSMTTGSMVGRTYFMYKDSLTGSMGSYDFSVFVAAQESMMSFPAVYDGSTLSGNAVNATVEISDDDGISWKLATDVGNNGVWSVTGLTLTDGVQDQIRIRLTVDGEMKTTDGSARTNDVNDYQTFNITPGMSM